MGELKRLDTWDEFPPGSGPRLDTNFFDASESRSALKSGGFARPPARQIPVYAGAEEW